MSEADCNECNEELLYYPYPDVWFCPECKKEIPDKEVILDE